MLESLSSSREVEPPGAESWFSVSRVSTMCPRSLVMASRLGIPFADDLDAQARWSMDRGTAMHAVFQERWLGPSGWLFGGWSCPECAKLHGGDGKDRWSVRLENAVPLPARCERCGHPSGRHDPFRFVEPYGMDSQLRVRGRSDGFLKLPGRGFEVMDLKFTARLDLVRFAPKPDHVSQIYWYLDAFSLRTGRLVYVDPGAKKVEEAMVEHTVNFDPNVMQREKEKVRVAREALRDNSKSVPPCPYGGKLAYGECPCVEVEVLWASAGNQSGP